MGTKEDYEFAAKAMGGLVYVEDMGWIEEDENGNRGKWWNPEDDDGDSRRLEVALCFSIYQSTSIIEVRIGEELIYRFVALETYDRAEATRLAVFRAAVEIGRSMK